MTYRLLSRQVTVEQAHERVGVHDADVWQLLKAREQSLVGGGRPQDGAEDVEVRSRPRVPDQGRLDAAQGLVGLVGVRHVGAHRQKGR